MIRIAISQCNVQTPQSVTFCVQYRVGATAAQAGSDKETPISKNTKFDIEAQKLRHRTSISYTDTEGAFVDIDKSSMSGYNNIEVLIFDIDVFSISYCINIEVPGFDIKDSSTSYWIDIEFYNIRYRRFSDFQAFDIDCQNLLSSCHYFNVISYPISKVVF